MKASILLLTDNPALVKRVRDSLRQHPLAVEVAPWDENSLEKARHAGISLVILDLIDRSAEGLTFCERLRGSSLVLIFLVVPAEEEQIGIRGLEVGADDFLTSEFYSEELAARVWAHLRRAGKVRTLTSYRTQDLHIDLTRRTVTVRGKSVFLTPTEFRLLASLMRYAGEVVPKETLLAEVWGKRYVDKVGYLKLYILYLRQKIELDPSNPEYILTDWGVGYRLLPPEE